MAADESLYGSYVPTTLEWEVENLVSADVTSPEFKELLVRLYFHIDLISDALNTKITGLYPPTEFIIGSLYPSNIVSPASDRAPRNVFRVTVDFGALPNAGIKTVAHGATLSAETTAVHLYGAATDPVTQNYIPLPNDTISLSADANNVIVNTNVTDWSAYTRSYIIFEYLKS